LDEELYEPNDNTPSLKTKVKLISETPVGWIMKADPNSGLPCFVNQSTGAKVRIIVVEFIINYIKLNI
jgi:hypothetical protein